MTIEEFRYIIDLRDKWITAKACINPHTGIQAAHRNYPGLREPEYYSEQLKEHFLKYYLDVPMFSYEETREQFGFMPINLRKIVNSSKVSDIDYGYLITLQEIIISMNRGGLFIMGEPSHSEHIEEWFRQAEGCIQNVLQGGNSDGISRESAS